MDNQQPGIIELTSDEAETVSGAMTALDAVWRGVIRGFVEAGGAVICNPGAHGYDCDFYP